MTTGLARTWEGRALASALLVTCMVTLPSGSSGRPEGTLRSEPRLGGAPHGPLSMSFVPNRGQSDARVRYQGQIGGANVWFTRHEAVLGLSAEGGRTALGLRFVGSDPHATVTGRHPRPGTVNYLIGSDAQLAALVDRVVPTAIKDRATRLTLGL